MSFRRTRGDHPNVLATPRVNNDEQAAHGAYAERNKPLLARVGFLICDRDRVRIIKDRDCLGHSDAVLAIIDPGFTLFVPLEPHHFSVRTSCAYVKCETVRLMESNWDR
jgi:hypothetical protein